MVMTVETSLGPLALRCERDEDRDFLKALFASHAGGMFAALPIDAAMRESLVEMQFASQTMTYRTRHARARFAIVERAGVPIGRLVVDEGSADEAACIVDIALLPDSRGQGFGSALVAGVVARLRGRVPAVTCTVLWNNEASLRMFRGLGFVHVGGELPYLRLEWRG